MGLPLASQKVVPLICWKVRSFPSASLMTSFCLAGSGSSGPGSFGSGSPSGFGLGSPGGSGSSGSPSHYGSLKCS